MKKILAFLLIIQCGTSGIEYEEFAIIETANNTSSTTTTTLTPTTTTLTPTTTIPLKQKYEYSAPNLYYVNLSIIDDYNFRVDIIFVYDNLNKNAFNGYYDAIENLTDCSVTLFTGQTPVDESIWSTTFRGDCVTTVQDDAVKVTKDINLNDSFTWDKAPNNQVAIMEILLYPITGNSDFYTWWLFTFGGECPSFNQTCDEHVSSYKNNPRTGPTRITKNSSNYSWIDPINGTIAATNLEYAASRYCSENISHDGNNWWAIFTRTPCFSRR
tara:strand:+ start:92 stop:904 length:813 start_codon:yes stop_codon:yes gene_type:complete